MALTAQLATPAATDAPGERNDLPRRCKYFVYGANLNRRQLHARCVKPVLVAVAMLPDYRLGFHGYSKIWDGAVETAVPCPGGELWGAVYELDFLDGERLDSWQDVRLDGTGTYFHYPTEVMDEQGAQHAVLVYKKDVLAEPRPPCREYLDWIIQGALEHELPDGYRRELQDITCTAAAYPVPRLPKFNPGLLAGLACTECGH